MLAKRFLWALCAASAVGASSSSPAIAGGLAVGSQSAEALAMASAVGAKPGLLSAGFHNPAIAGGELGVRAHAGALFIIPTFEVSDPAGTDKAETVASVRTVPHVYGSYVARGEGLIRGLSSLGFVLYAGAPYGAGVAYDPGWRGRFDVVEADLKTFLINPSAVVSIQDVVSFAAGPQLIRGAIELTRKVDLISHEATVHLGGGAGFAAGAALGAHIQILKGLYLGLAFKSRVTLDFEGSVDFKDLPPSFYDQARDQAVTTSITLPDRFSASAYYEFDKKGGVGVGVEYYNWSVLKSLDVNFAEDKDLSTSLPRDWHGTATVHLGGEYAALPFLAARGGIYYDPSVSPDETLSPASPDGDRYGLTLGAGAKLGPARVDAGYAYIYVAGRASRGDAFPAKYGGSAHVLSVSLGYVYEPPPKAAAPKEPVKEERRPDVKGAIDPRVAQIRAF
jgi:long-chain fatty acid transport protein